MLNITLLGSHSAGIAYSSSDKMEILYVSGIVRKVDSCYFYSVNPIVDLCPNIGKCFVSSTDTCDICDSG